MTVAVSVSQDVDGPLRDTNMCVCGGRKLEEGAVVVGTGEEGQRRRVASSHHLSAPDD